MADRPRAVFAMGRAHLPALFPADLISRLTESGATRALGVRRGLRRRAPRRRPRRGRSPDHRLGLPARGRGRPGPHAAAAGGPARRRHRPRTDRRRRLGPRPAGDERGGGQRAAGGRVHPRRGDIRGQGRVRRTRPLPRPTRGPDARTERGSRRVPAAASASSAPRGSGGACSTSSGPSTSTSSVCDPYLEPAQAAALGRPARRTRRTARHAATSSACTPPTSPPPGACSTAAGSR